MIAYQYNCFNLFLTGKCSIDRSNVIPFLRKAKLFHKNEKTYLKNFKDFVKKDTIFCFLGLSKVFNLKLLKKYLVFIVENDFVAFSKTLGFKKANYKTLKTFV